MWKVKTECGYYTVYFCPQCKRQTTFHTVDYNVYKCDICNLQMIYNDKTDRLKL